MPGNVRELVLFTERLDTAEILPQVSAAPHSEWDAKLTLITGKVTDVQWDATAFACRF